MRKIPTGMLREVTTEPPGTEPEQIAPTPQAEKEASHGLKNTVSEQAAQQGASHTQIPLYSLAGGANGANPANTGAAASGQPAAPSGNHVSLGSLIEGKFAVGLMDALLPALLVVALYSMGIKLRKTDLQLTTKEQETVGPVFQACLDSIHLNFDSPWTMLAITLGAIYGGKLVEKGGIELIDKMAEKKLAKLAEAEKATSDQETGRPDTRDPSMVDLQQTENGGFTEGEIALVRKRKKVGREAAILYLTNKAQGKARS